jgi:hypothetical protein
MKRLVLLSLFIIVFLLAMAESDIDFICEKVGREIILATDLIKKIQRMKSVRNY